MCTAKNKEKELLHRCYSGFVGDGLVALFQKYISKSAKYFTSLKTYPRE
jgi:hypothetical protein